MFRFFKKKKGLVETQNNAAPSSPNDFENPSNLSSKKPLVKNKDFYIENGNYVFTEFYLKNRGFCCENRCRHCPYGIHEK